MPGSGRLKPFLEALAEGPLLFDGAMGSLLYDRGVFHTRSYDELNLSQPKLIRSIHRDYLDAGAQILETNSFGANRIALARHGLADRLAEFNRAAVELARHVADNRAYIAGAVGPTGIKFAVAPSRERSRAVEALAEQIDAPGPGRRRSHRARDLHRHPRDGDRDRGRTPGRARAADRGADGVRSARTGRGRAARPRTSPSACSTLARTWSAPTAASARPSSTTWARR